MGRTEQRPFDTHAGRMVNATVKNLIAKRVDMESGGRLETSNADVIFSGTGGSFVTTTLLVSQSSTFNGATSFNNSSSFNGPSTFSGDFTIVNSGNNVTINPRPTFSNGIVADGALASVFSGGINASGAASVFNNGFISTGSTTQFYNPVTFTNSNIALLGTSFTSNTGASFSGDITAANGNIAGNLNVIGEYISNGGINVNGNITGGSIFIGGAASISGGLNVSGALVSNGITVGDPNNVGIFSGGILTALTGSTLFEIKESTANGGNTSFLYTSATGSIENQTGMSMYNNSSERVFYIDNTNGSVSLTKPIQIQSSISGSTLIISQNTNVDKTNLSNFVLIGNSNSLSSFTLGDNINIIGNQNYTTENFGNDSRNVGIYGNNNTLHQNNTSPKNIFGSNNAIISSNISNIFGNSNISTSQSGALIVGNSNDVGTFINSNVDNTIIGTNNRVYNTINVDIYGSNNSITGGILLGEEPTRNLTIIGRDNYINKTPNPNINGKSIICGYENNMGITGSIFVLGNGWTKTSIVGGGQTGASTGQNTVLLGDNLVSNIFRCKMIIAGGLSLQVAGEGGNNVIPPIPPDFTYSQLANVKIVSSKTNTYAPENGNALYQLIQDSSSRRYKSQITSLDNSFIQNFDKLNPVSYVRGGMFEYGLIAEDLAEIDEFKPFVGVNADGEIDSIEYDRLIVLAIAKIKEQNKIIENLQSRISIIEEIVLKKT